MPIPYVYNREPNLVITAPEDVLAPDGTWPSAGTTTTTRYYFSLGIKYFEYGFADQTTFSKIASEIWRNLAALGLFRSRDNSNSLRSIDKSCLLHPTNTGTYRFPWLDARIEEIGLGKLIYIAAKNTKFWWKKHDWGFLNNVKLDCQITKLYTFAQLEI